MKEMTNLRKTLAFDDYPAFYQDDNRRNRGFNPTSKAFLEAKFGVLLPEHLLKGKKVLDLGSCYGAAGQWVLYNGAASYTGVEVQQNYVSESRRLLAHWQDRVEIVHQDVTSYLLATADQAFDLVLLAGMLYHFVDTKQIIDQACRIASQQVVVETNYPPGMRSGKLPMDVAVTEYVTDQEVNLDHGNQSMLGISATTSLSALDILFRLNGFAKQENKLVFPLGSDTVIYDESALGSSDLQIRFAVRYFRDEKQQRLTTLESNLPEQSGQKRSWENDPVATARTDAYQRQAKALASTAKPGEWKFDAQVAEVFDGIARREIPDYLRVIDLCVRVIGKGKLEQPKIIDVGSATGETLRQLHQAGYRNLYGVDASADMLAQSFQQATLIHSEDFPEAHGPFDYVLNNWTLHFIRNPLNYLEAIKRSLAPGGTLILSDKVSSSECVHDLYYDYKRTNGVTEEEILRKRQQIEGVLVTYPFTWYLNALTNLGFEQIEIINANAAFVTFMAVNPAE
ncbi:class I SAM-dependent methyltransferase [Thiothrix litoralis]|uniref:Class I SAM-dependent methyltransferase n=2 Tax=Thiothrix litoralis TaxID=2891210 RepID=A0ABX7WYC0_9GAMM|nr:class I SAM-dependent methyltransferase [Thiothrix litoralis]